MEGEEEDSSFDLEFYELEIVNDYTGFEGTPYVDKNGTLLVEVDERYIMDYDSSSELNLLQSTAEDTQGNQNIMWLGIAALIVGVIIHIRNPFSLGERRLGHIAMAALLGIVALMLLSSIWTISSEFGEGVFTYIEDDFEANTDDGLFGSAEQDLAFGGITGKGTVKWGLAYHIG